MTITKDVSTEIRVLLARRGMSQRDLATRLGLSTMALSRRMTGQIAWGIDELQRVALAFDVPITALVPERSAS